MPETQVYNPSEQRIAPDEASAAESIFNGVYQSFADVAKNAPTKRSDFIDGEVKSVAVDPQQGNTAQICTLSPQFIVGKAKRRGARER
jgi:predicted ATP-grasp superfamily ATP-dependent carboligase